MTKEEIIAALDAIHAEMEQEGWTDTEWFNAIGVLIARAKGEDNA